MVFTRFPTVGRCGMSISCRAPEREQSDQGPKLLPISLFSPVMGYFRRQLFPGPETPQYLSVYVQSATELFLPEDRDATIRTITDAKSSVSLPQFSQRLNRGRLQPCCLIRRIRFLPLSSSWSSYCVADGRVIASQMVELMRRGWSSYCVEKIAWGYETSLRAKCNVAWWPFSVIVWGLFF